MVRLCYYCMGRFELWLLDAPDVTDCLAHTLTCSMCLHSLPQSLLSCDHLHSFCFSAQDMEVFPMVGNILVLAVMEIQLVNMVSEYLCCHTQKVPPINLLSFLFCSYLPSLQVMEECLMKLNQLDWALKPNLWENMVETFKVLTHSWHVDSLAFQYSQYKVNGSICVTPWLEGGCVLHTGLFPSVLSLL